MNGVTVIITMPDGHVAACETDFHPGSPAGFTVEEMQTMRATERAWHSVMEGYSSCGLAKAICADNMTVRQIARRLEGHGWRVTAKPISVDVPATETDS